MGLKAGSLFGAQIERNFLHNAFIMVKTNAIGDFVTGDVNLYCTLNEFSGIDDNERPPVILFR